MRDYEIVYIFRSSFTPEEIEAKLERYHALITEGGRGEITAVAQWGKRQLAYPIQKQISAYYVVAQFTAEPEVLAGLERVLKLEDDLLRYLVVLSEGELPLPTTPSGDEASEPPAGEGPGSESGEATAAEAPAAAADDADEAAEGGDEAASEAEEAGSDDEGSEEEEVAGPSEEADAPGEEASDEAAGDADEKEG